MCMSPGASEEPDLLVFEMGLVTWAVTDPDLLSQDLNWRRIISSAQLSSGLCLWCPSGLLCRPDSVYGFD